MSPLSTISTANSAIGFSREAARLQRAETLHRGKSSPASAPEEVREAFTQFVGESFYAQMLKSMRSSLGKPAYFHGGRAEEIFTGQLDQTLAEELADKSTQRLIDPLFERQFPWLAEQLRQGSGETNTSAQTPQ
jgi:Rod binding domain-containing protein